MKEVSSCQENIDTEAISEKKKKKAEFVAQTKWAFLLAKNAQLSWKFDLEATRKHNK